MREVRHKQGGRNGEVSRKQMPGAMTSARIRQWTNGRRTGRPKTRGGCKVSRSYKDPVGAKHFQRVSIVIGKEHSRELTSHQSVKFGTSANRPSRRQVATSGKRYSVPLGKEKLSCGSTSTELISASKNSHKPHSPLLTSR